MRSDEITVLEPELVTKDNGKGVRLFAYASSMSGKDGSALGNKAKNNSGISGLMKELEKTKLDV